MKLLKPNENLFIYFSVTFSFLKKKPERVMGDATLQK